MILALIGGGDIKKYTIADVMWNKLSQLSGIDFEFQVVDLLNFTELLTFYWSFYENKDFVGFNVALPWKSEVVKLIDSVSSDSRVYGSINTVYKNSNIVCGANTDIVGVENSIINSNQIDLHNKKILIIGGGGAGLPTALYLSQKYECICSIFDINEVNIPKSNVVFLKNISDVAASRYDLIINATSVGKYYLDKKPELYALPLSIEVLEKITHSGTLVQEMNYFPLTTELMRYAQSRKLQVISGINMLVYQAVASFKLYTGYELSTIKTVELIKYLEDYVINKEYELLRQNTISA